ETTSRFPRGAGRAGIRAALARRRARRQPAARHRDFSRVQLGSCAERTDLGAGAHLSGHAVAAAVHRSPHGRAPAARPPRRRFIDRLMQALQRQPGVSAAGLVTNVPFSGRDIKSAITVEGWRPAPGDSVRGHYGYGVGRRYFMAMGMPLVEGRFLDPGDIQRGDRVVVVDDDFAGRYWPGGSALGHRLFAGPRTGSDAEAYTIVGV